MSSVRCNGSDPLTHIRAAVKEARSEGAQVNAVVRALAAAGYPEGKAASPEVHDTTIDRAAYRIYVWRDTPLGDHVVLGAGPSFSPEVALGSQIPAEPGVGVYIKAALAKGSRALSGAARTASRAAPKPTAAAEVAAERVARKVRAPKKEVLAAATEIAEAAGAATVTVAHVEAVVEAAQANVPDPVRAAEASVVEQVIALRTDDRLPAASKVDMNAAMREAQELIAALRSMRGAS